MSTSPRARQYDAEVIASPSVARICLALALPCVFSAFGCAAPMSDAGTPDQRAGLFSAIISKTRDRQAVAPTKNATLDFDPIRAMRAERDGVVDAETASELFYALSRLSAARRDRHLSTMLVSGGISPALTDGLATLGDVETAAPRHAPIRVFPDYGQRSEDYFIGDLAEGYEEASRITPGDRVVQINGLHISEYVDLATPYIPHSTAAALRWEIAEVIPQRSGVLHPSLFAEELLLMLEDGDGRFYSVTLGYHDAAALTWRNLAEPAYAGFTRVGSLPTYDLLRPDDGRRIAILLWRGFGTALPDDVDALVARAGQEGWLDHALIIDVTRSRGGSLGSYALQRLQPRAFKTAFGTLRLSDVTEPFIAVKRAELALRAPLAADSRETIDSGAWLLDWLENDVIAGLVRGDLKTAPVPFKLAHAPKDSDGVLEPAPLHFSGPLVVISGPSGGAHLDQFNSIVADNDLGAIIGMPAGGYSNTWEWEEELVFPGTSRPVVGFMWSIGQTIRPNGEILEGNPATPDVWEPLTANGFAGYYARLYDHAEAWLDSVGHSIAQ